MLNENTLGDELTAKIESHAEDLFRNLTDFQVSGDEGCCLYWAMATTRACREQGLRADLMAGTANWLCNHEPHPTLTHVGHFWQHPSDLMVERFFSIGILPEMHCWCYLPEYGMIMDPCTRGVRLLAEKAGIPFKVEEPPRFFASNVIPSLWMYKPYRSAARTARKAILNIAINAFHELQESKD